MALALVGPNVSLVDRYADEMGHHVGQPVVVIALYPDDFDLPFRIRQLANVREELPVVARQPAEIQIGENIA